MKHRNLSSRFVVAIAAFALLTAACGSGDTSDASADVEQVQMAMDGAHFMNAAPFAVASEKFWPEMGYTQEPKLAITSEIIPGLLAEEVWMGQIESQPLWAALSQGGSDDLVVVGVEKGYELWTLGVGPGIEEPEDLVGKRVTGGPPGERNVTVMESMLKEVGVSPEEVEFVTVEGGSDEYFRAILAEQVVAAPVRSRHIVELENAGGSVLFDEVVTAPQEVWVTRRSFLEENPGVVRDFLQGIIEAKRWAASGSDMARNRDEAFEITESRGYEAEAGEYETWADFIEENWSLSGGASAATFDKWTADMAEIGIVSEEFDWRPHVNFEPLWDAQEALGIERDPDPSEFEN